MGKLIKTNDITLRQRTEESLIASETRYRRLFESAKDGILILDAETGRIMDVNPFLTELLGYSKEKFIEKEIWEIGFFKDIVANYDKFIELQQKEYVRYENLPLETIDGQKINVEFVSNVYLEDKKKVIQCNIRDITKRKQAELAQRNSEIHFRTLVQTIPDLIWLKDTEGVYISCNPMFEHLFGAKESDIVGKTDYDFVDRELASFFRMNDRKAMEAGKPTINEEWVSFSNDGHRAYLETIKTPMYDSYGMLLGVLGIGRDVTGRYLAEESIKKQKEEFETIFNLVPAQIWYKDAHNNFIRVNHQACIDIGLTNDKIEGHSADELFPSFAQQYFIDDLEVINARKPKLGITEQFNTANGEIRWAHSDKIPVFGNDSEVIGLIVLVQDITERKRAEEELKQANSELENLHNNLDEAVFSVDTIHNKMLHVSIANETVFGYSQEAFFNNPQLWYEIVVSEDKPIIDAGYPVLFSGKNLHHEYRIVHPDGQIRWIEAKMNPTLDMNGKLIRIDGIASNITDRKRKEIELLEKEVQYHNLANSGLALIWTAGTDKLCNYFNESWLKFTGRSLEQELGNGWAEGVHPDDFDSCLKTYITAFDNREKFDMEYRLRHVSGEYRWISDLGTPNYNSNGEFIGYIGHCFDITDHKQTEQELIKAKEKAEESDHLKSAFLANMSHEVRTPLNSIIGFSELLADPDFEEESKVEFIQQIIANGNNLLNIISDIMDISKIESHEITIRKSWINIQNFITTIQEQFASQAVAKNLYFGLIIPENDETVVIFADSERLRQIFNNLVGNAIKFTGKGSINISYHLRDKFVEFQIRDTGIGIPAEFHDKIFDRFRQVETATTRKYGGNGLGLAISKNLIELMGGKIWLESKPCKGSVFHFTLPCEDIPNSVG